MSPCLLLLIFFILEWLHFGALFFFLSNWGALDLKFGGIYFERWFIS